MRRRAVRELPPQGFFHHLPQRTALAARAVWRRQAVGPALTTAPIVADAAAHIGDDALGPPTVLVGAFAAHHGEQRLPQDHRVE